MRYCVLRSLVLLSSLSVMTLVVTWMLKVTEVKALEEVVDQPIAHLYFVVLMQWQIGIFISAGFEILY